MLLVVELEASGAFIISHVVELDVMELRRGALP
jgi:hypothetical protein